MLTSAVRQQCETYLPQCGPSIGNRVVAKGVCVRVGVRDGDGVRRGASWFNKSTKKQNKKKGSAEKKKNSKASESETTGPGIVSSPPLKSRVSHIG